MGTYSPGKKEPLTICGMILQVLSFWRPVIVGCLLHFSRNIFSSPSCCCGSDARIAGNGRASCKCSLLAEKQIRYYCSKRFLKEVWQVQLLISGQMKLVNQCGVLGSMCHVNVGKERTCATCYVSRCSASKL